MSTPHSGSPDSAASGYPDGSMRVEQSATPDGRLLLYFTFPHSEMPSGATDDGTIPAGSQPREGTV